MNTSTTSLVQELKRRNVFRAAIAYLAVSWFIVEVATTILPLYPEAPVWLARSIVTVLVIGFIPALLLSWVFEFTSTGLRRETQKGLSSASRAGINRVVDFVAGGAVVAAIALFLWSPQSSNRVPSVAVLPFSNMSANVEDEYLSDGLTETLIHMIAQIPSIKVTSRTSVFALKDKDIDVREIGDMLDVAHVLEGSLQRAGDRLRITAQLIDTADGTHIWSKNYDRNTNDVFSIQDEIASVVANALRESLLVAPNEIAGVGTRNLSAYDLFLHAVSRRVPTTTDALAAAESLLKEALLIDPDFTNAKTELGSVYFDQWSYGFKAAEDALPEILTLTEEVLTRNEADSRATALRLIVQAELALINGEMDVIHDIVDKFSELIERSPSEIDARIFMARVLRYVGDPVQQLAQLRAAANIDPLRADIYWMMVNSQRQLGDMEGAEASVRRSLELNPNQVNAYITLASLLRQNGDSVGYIENYVKAWRIDPSDIELITRIASHLYRLKLVAEGDSYLQHAIAISPDHPAVQYALLVRAAAQDDDELVIERAKVLIAESSDGNGVAGWMLAVKLILRSGINLGRGDEMLAYILQYAPDFSSESANSVALHVRQSQMFAVAELAQLLPDEDLRKLIAEIDEFMIATSGEVNSVSGYYIPRLIVLGQLEEAIEVYVNEVFAQPPDARPAEEWRLASAFYADLMADERMQVALARSVEEVDEVRERVRQFVATSDY